MGKCGPSRANFPNDQGQLHDKFRLAVDIGKISNQHAVGCNQSKQEVTRVDKLLSEMICN